MAAPSAVSQVQGAPEALPDIANLSVISVHDSKPVLLTSLWSDAAYPRTIVCFLRHWMSASVAARVGGGPVASKEQVRLVFIGCGAPTLGNSIYKRLVSAEVDPQISMYTDPKREAYTAMGTSVGIPKFYCGKCLSGCCSAMWQGLTRCWCFCSAGNVEQQGAAFVMTPQQTCVFKHLEKEPGDHADPNALFAAAGLSIPPPAADMK